MGLLNWFRGLGKTEDNLAVVECKVDASDSSDTLTTVGFVPEPSTESYEESKDEETLQRSLDFPLKESELVILAKLVAKDKWDFTSGVARADFPPHYMTIGKSRLSKDRSLVSTVSLHSAANRVFVCEKTEDVEIQDIYKATYEKFETDHMVRQQLAISQFKSSIQQPIVWLTPEDKLEVIKGLETSAGLDRHYAVLSPSPQSFGTPNLSPDMVEVGKAPSAPVRKSKKPLAKKKK